MDSDNLMAENQLFKV